MQASTTTPTSGSDTQSFATAVLAPFRDAWLGSRVRLAIFAAAGTAASTVLVETYHGRVVLAGDVASAPVRDTIVRAVRELPGVVGVEDRLRIRGAGFRRPAGGDAETRFRVTAALRHHAALRNGTIHVAGIYDGVVTLAGSAASPAAAELAFELVTQLPGVRRVISDVAIHHNADAGSDADAA